MQIARVFATPGDNVAGLADLLRSRGFEVEVITEDRPTGRAAEWISELQQLSLLTTQENTHQTPTETSDWPIWKLLEGTEPQTEPSVTVEDCRPKPDWESVMHATCEAGNKAFHQGRRVVFALAPDERLFRKLATITAVAAVFVLLLSAARPHRLSPLPADVLQNSKEASQTVPFQTRAVTAAETAAQALETTTANPELRLSGQEKPAAAVDSEIIAKDTVIRYKRRRRVPHAVPNTQPSGKTLTN